MDILEDDSEEEEERAQVLLHRLQEIKEKLRELYVALNVLKLDTKGEWKIALQRVRTFQEFFESSLLQKLPECVSGDEREIEILLMIHDARNHIGKLGLTTELHIDAMNQERMVKSSLIKGLRGTYRHLIVLSHNYELDRALKMIKNQHLDVVNLTDSLPENGLKSAILSRRLARVLQNLIENARKAMEAEKKRDREIGIPNHTVLAIQMDVSLNGDFVEILVTDNGPGLLGRDPFVGSTQEDGQTHGIGLTKSRELCRAVGGDLLALEDAPRGGARFLVRIPLLNEAGAEPKGGHEE